MTRIVTCYKWVIDEADIKINADLSIDFSKAKGKISDYDRNAIEVAVQLAAATEGKACGLTYGDASAKPSLKDALSRGLDESFYINSKTAGQADALLTSNALASALRKIEDVSLVICAEGASDTYQRQIAPRLGALLDYPVITSLIEVNITGSTLVGQRRLDDCLQTVQVELPAVIAVLPEIVKAPIPGIKAVLAAGKKPVVEFGNEDLDLEDTTINQEDQLKGYAMNRKNVIFDEGDMQTNVNALTAALRREGVL